MAVTELIKEKEQKDIQQLSQKKENRFIQNEIDNPQMVANVQGAQTTIQRTVTVGQAVDFGTIPPIQDGRINTDRLSGKEAKKRLVTRRKSRIGLPVDPNEMQEIERFAQSKWAKENWLNKKKGSLTIQDIREDVQKGTYDNFEKLDDVFRDIEATKRMTGFNMKFLDGYSVTAYRDFSQEEVEKIVDAMEKDNLFFDPVLRLGLSQFANYEERNGNKSVYRKIDNEIAKRIMIKTLTFEMNDTQQEKYKERLIENGKATKGNVDSVFADELKANKAKTTQMVKQLFLMHLGKLQIVSKNYEGELNGKEPDVPMASILAHCSRTMIITPNFNNDSDEADMWNSILRQRVNGKYYNHAQIRKRGASTHSVERKEIGKKFGKETKKLIIAPNLIRQTGMDVAIGGLGAGGVGGKMLDQDGSCGHVYGMRKRSEKGKCGAYLFGYESDSYAHTNQLGHTHNLMATGEKSSSFLCQRTDEIGAKYSGRQADISKISGDIIVKCMNRIDEIFMNDMLLENAQKQIVEKLCGNILKGNDFNNLLRDMYFEENEVNAISGARG